MAFLFSLKYKINLSSVENFFVNSSTLLIVYILIEVIACYYNENSTLLLLQ